MAVGWGGYEVREKLLTVKRLDVIRPTSMEWTSLGLYARGAEIRRTSTTGMHLDNLRLFSYGQSNHLD